MSHLSRWLPVVLLASTVGAQTAFFAELSGDQETPPVASGGTGTGEVLLDPLTGGIQIRLSVSGVTGVITAAHIHRGALGTPGGVAVGLTGTGPSWSDTATLGPADMAMLMAGDLYFNVHTTTFPGGELRGQIAPARRRFDAYGLGSKEVPANGSPGIAVAELTLMPTNQIAYTVNATGTLGAVTVAHIHEGPVGTNGPVVFALTSTGGGTFAGMTAPLTPLERAKLRSGRYYVNVHTSTLPGGELRGQVTGAFVDYGTGCAGSLGVPVLDGRGTPVPASPFSIDVSGGASLGAGAVLVGGGAGSTPVLGCNFLLNLSLPILSAPVPLDVLGRVSLPFNIPAPIPTGWLSFQFAGIDSGAANGAFSLSNGLGVQLNN